MHRCQPWHAACYAICRMDHARPKSHARSTKRIAAASILSFAAVGGGLRLASIDFRSRRVDRSKLSIETVQRGMLEIKVAANGRLVPKNTEQLASQVNGRVAKVLVRPGDQVEAGRCLVELTNLEIIASAEEAYSAWEGAATESRAARSELQNDLLNQQSVLTRAQFELEKAQLQLEAETKLISEQLISEIDYKRTKLNVAQLTKVHEIESSRLQKLRDNIEVQLAVKEARVTQLARALDRARSQAANLKVVAGMDGIVQAIEVDVGQQLQPGSPIGLIAQHDQLYAELDIPAREAAELQAGQAAMIDTRSGTVEGIVTRIDPGVREGTVRVDVELRGESPAGARPQLQVEGIVYIDRITDALFVGKPAWVKSNSEIAVYKLDETGRYADRVAIKSGKVSINHLQILKGLQPGDRIITSETDEWRSEEKILLN